MSAVREALGNRRRGRRGSCLGSAPLQSQETGDSVASSDPSLPPRQPRAATGLSICVLESGLVSSPRSHLQAEDDGFCPNTTLHSVSYGPALAVNIPPVITIASPCPPSRAAGPASRSGCPPDRQLRALAGASGTGLLSTSLESNWVLPAPLSSRALPDRGPRAEAPACMHVRVLSGHGDLGSTASPLSHPAAAACWRVHPKPGRMLTWTTDRLIYSFLLFRSRN